MAKLFQQRHFFPSAITIRYHEFAQRNFRKQIKSTSHVFVMIIDHSQVGFQLMTPNIFAASAFTSSFAATFALAFTEAFAATFAVAFAAAEFALVFATSFYCINH